MTQLNSCIIKLELYLLGRVTCLLINSQLFTLVKSMYPYFQWPFQDPKLEVPTIYKAYVMPM